MSLPDISEWYTGSRALQAEINWINEKPHEKYYLPFLLPRIGKFDVKSIVEFGCGTGHIAKALPENIDYLGVDKNAWFVKKAQIKLGKDKFVKEDIRQFNSLLEHDLSMAWMFMKHFDLTEWDNILDRILGEGKFATFDAQISVEELDNGEEYHHVFVTEERVRKAVQDCGHEIVEQQTLWEFDVPVPAKTVAFWTRKCQAT